MDPSLAAAVHALASDGLVVYPTDTLVGLGARATSATAVSRLVAAKARPAGQPVSIAVASLEESEPWVRWTPATRAYARRTLPGPVTLLVPASERATRELAPGILSSTNVLGLRLPDHPVARALAGAAGPITATSANRHGSPPARTLAAARRAFGAEVACYLPLRPAPSGRPSQLVDLTGGAPRIRPRA